MVDKPLYNIIVAVVVVVMVVFVVVSRRQSVSLLRRPPTYTVELEELPCSQFHESNAKDQSATIQPPILEANGYQNYESKLISTDLPKWIISYSSGLIVPMHSTYLMILMSSQEVLLFS